MENHTNNSTALGVPTQPERTAEQLISIQAAMMEELGITRKDTLPLEDRGYDGHVPLSRPIQPRAPTIAGVSRWHNIAFNDVDEATAQLDNIADGQLYRLRRGASSGPNHSLSSRGGHSSSNILRGGRGGTPVRSSQVKDGRDGLSSGFARRGRASSSGYVRPNTVPSSNTPATVFNDARRGVNNHARIEKAIATLKGTPRTIPSSIENHSQPSSKASRYGSLVDPDDFVSAMGLFPRARIVPVPSKSNLQNKPISSALPPSSIVREISTIVQAPIPASNGTTISSSSPGPSLTAAPVVYAKSSSSTSQSVAVVAAAASLRSRPESSSVAEVSAIVRAPTPTFVNRSTGLASSRWATQQTAATSSATPSFSTSSVATSDASVASTPTRAVPSRPAASMSIPALVLKASNSLNNSNASAASFSATPTFSPLLAVSKSSINVPAMVNGPAAAAAPSVTSPRTPIPSVLVAVEDSATRTVRPDASSPNSNGSEALNSCRVPAASTTMPSGRAVLIEKIVKANKNGCPDRPAKIRLVKTLNYIALEFEVSHILQLHQPLSESVSFSSNTSTCTMFFIRSDTYKFTFRFPHEASAFEQFLLAADLRPILKAPERMNDSFAAGFNPQTVVLNVPENANDSPATCIEAPSAVLNVTENVSHSSVPVIETPTPPIDRSVHNALEDMDESPLIDFSEEIPSEMPPLPEGGSALDDLACMNDDPMVAGVVQMLNKRAGGSLLNSKHGMSAQALLSAVENTTLAFLNGCSVFRFLPEDIALTYAKETSKKALELVYAETQESYNIERNSPLEADDISSYCNNATLSAEASAPENDRSQQVTDSQKVDEPQQLIESHRVNDRRKPYMYSVQELIGLRDDASKIEEELISRTEELKTDNNLLQPISRRSSRANNASKSGTKPYQAVFQDHGSCDLNSAASKPALAPSTPHNLQPSSQVTSEVKTSTKNQYLHSDPALHGSILSAIGQKSPIQVQSKGIHHSADSKDLTTLATAFSDLKIVADSHPPAAAVSIPSLNVGLGRQSPSKATQQVGLAASAQSFTPTETIRQPAAEVARTESTWPSSQQKTILETSNKKEDMEKAKVPGLSASKWSTSQENVGFQSFCPRPLMLDHRTSNASSTASDLKFDKHTPTSPPDSSRLPLSPRKANIQETLQERLQRSLVERHN